MPLNYRKNNLNCSVQDYSNVSDLNGPGICKNVKFNLNYNGQQKYIGLVSPTHEQAGDISVNFNGNNLKLANKSKLQSRAYAWGYNWYGLIGNCRTPAFTCTTSPVLVCGNRNFCKIETNDNHTVGLTIDGVIFSWGENTSGQLGIGSYGGIYCAPIQLCSNDRFCEISAGFSSSYGIRCDGALFAWGKGDLGGLGNGGISCACLPIRVCSGSLFCKITGGNGNVAAIRQDGIVFTWGTGIFGQIGNGTSPSCQLTPVQICCGFCFTDICSGAYHVLALRNNGVIYGWGQNCEGQLGNGTLTASYNLPIIAGGSLSSNCCFNRISSGFSHSLALTRNGNIYSWGSNSCGELGNNSTTRASSPVLAVTSGNLFCAISGGVYHSLAIRCDLRMYGWGRNDYGQVGDATVATRLIPVLVCQTKTFCLVKAGSCVSYGLEYEWLLQ